MHKIGRDHKAMKVDGEASLADDDHGSGEMAMGHMHEGPPVGKTLGQRLINWLGRLHAMVIHFPIAMIIGAFGVEAFGLWRRNAADQEAARRMSIVGSPGAIAVLASVLAYLSFVARRRSGRPRAFYWILHAALTVAISIQG